MAEPIEGIANRRPVADMSEWSSDLDAESEAILADLTPATFRALSEALDDDAEEGRDA